MFDTAERLLVPFAVEAILSNDKNMDEKKYNLVSPNYTLLEDTILGINLATPPFHESDQTLEKGAHLHFILPDGLTHGLEIDGTIAFPEIPTRWLVTRFFQEEGHSRCHIQKKTWLVESDFVSAKVGPYNQHSVLLPTLDDNEFLFQYLGRAYEWGEQPTEEGRLNSFTVLGTGDAAFAAYYPNCRSALGFYDPLEDVEGGFLTYLVTGWYSDPQKDPLSGLDGKPYEEKLEQLQWDVPKGHTPNQCLFHGMVCGLQWRGPGAEYDSGRPRGEVKMAMGNTSAEAMSALLSEISGDSHTERLLNALQYHAFDVITEQDGIAKAEELIFKHSFAQSDGGKLWSFRGTGESNCQDIPQGLQKELWNLNQFQRELDREKDREACHKEDLFCIWHTYLAKYESPPAKDTYPFRNDIYQEYLRVAGILEKHSENINHIDDKIKRSSAKITNEIKEGGFPLQLEAKPFDCFYRPLDPVLLFSGEGLRRPYIYGEDGRFSKNGKLNCRVTGNEITGFTYQIEGETVTITSEELARLIGEWVQQEELPKDLFALALETILLDINSACLLALLGYQKLQKQFSEKELKATTQKIEQKILAPWVSLLHSETSTEYGHIGSLPVKLAVHFYSPPWNTLFLEWDVSYLPTDSSAGSNNSFAGWIRNGIDFDYDGSIPQPLHPPSYTGRTIVTAQSARTLADSIRKKMECYSKENPLYEKLKRWEETVKGLAVLSQSLGGFTDELLSRRYGLQMPIMITSEWLLSDKNANDMCFDLNRRLNGMGDFSPLNTKQFFPIRAGFLRCNQAWLVNSFGQRQTIQTSLDDTLLAETLKPLHHFKAASLSPKFAYWTRLLLNWLPISEECTSPVAGYLIPNRLNHGLMVYNPDGILIGTILLSFLGKYTRGIWSPLPTNRDYSQLQKDDRGLNRDSFENEQLYQLVYSLLEVNAEEPFQELLDSLDCWQSSIEPESDTHAAELSLLCGKAIAVLRASLTLEAKGRPPHRQDLAHWGKEDCAEHDAQLISVEIGDGLRYGDGVLGIFPDKEEGMYGQMLSAGGRQAPSGFKPHYVQYNDNVKLNLKDHHTQNMTILVEVMGDITVKTGLLPVRTEQFPEEYCRKAVERMNMAYPIQPIVSPKDEIRIPFGLGEEADWSWAVPTVEKQFSFTKGISAFGSNFGSPPIIMDGYLIRQPKEGEDHS